MPTTTNWALRYPAATDNNDVPLHMSQLATDADGMAQFAKGTFGARPTAVTAKSGKYYLATDTATLYLSDGTDWIEVAPGAGSVPIGGMIGYAGAGDPADTRYLLADGRAISRATYAVLFALEGTTYGAGDGSTTFNIPDERGRVAASPDNMGTAQGAASRMTGNNTRGAVGGTEAHTLTTAQMPSHVHGLTAPTADITGGGGGSYRTMNAAGSGGSNYQPALFNIAVIASGGDASHPNTQPYLVVNKLIRVA